MHVYIFGFLLRFVEDIELFPGGTSEFPVPNGLVGPTFACIIGKQFEKLRTGDRFWFENDGQPGSMNEGKTPHSLFSKGLDTSLCLYLLIQDVSEFVFVSRRSCSKRLHIKVPKRLFNR